MENNQPAKDDRPGFWKRVTSSLAFVALLLGVFVSIKTLSSCAGPTPETKLASNAGSSSTATSSTTATASPTQNQRLSLTLFPPSQAPSQSAPKSDHGGVSVGVNNGQINGPGAHHNSQNIYEGADKEEVKRVKAQLEAIRSYSDVARLTFKGLPLELSGGGDIVFSSALSNAMKPAFEEIDANHSHFSCSDTALAALEKTKDSFPKFPFSYYGLAYCLMKAGDARWRGYALTLDEILEQTTTIDGHAPDHDKALKETRAALFGQ